LLIAVPYLALSPLYFPRLAHKFAIVGVDALTMLFWFAGFIALAVFHHDLILCYGNVCNVMVAAIVFAAFEWYVHFHLLKRGSWSGSENCLRLRQWPRMDTSRIANNVPLHRILFAATTVLGALHVMRTRNSTSTKPAANMEVNTHQMGV